LLCCLLAVPGCGGPEEEPGRVGVDREALPERVFLIGIDGASPRIAMPLAKLGAMPNLSRLAAEGVSGHLRSFPPLRSPRIWTTVATGKVAKKHGVLSFVRREEDGTRRLLRSSDRTAHALWNIASAAGLRVAVVNWWTTQPPERIDGVMVSDHFLADHVMRMEELFGTESRPTASTVFPVDWQDSVNRIAARGEPPIDFDDPFAGNEGLPHWADPDQLSSNFGDDAIVSSVALSIEEALAPDLLMVLLPGIDRVSHVLWGALEPEDHYPEQLRPSPPERAAGRLALRRYYEYTDALIGRLIANATPRDLVVVVSDHGFEGGIPEFGGGNMGGLTGKHASTGASHGVLFARGPGIAAGTKTRGVTVNDITPTILAWLGLPVAEDMDGRVARFLSQEQRDAVRRIATYDIGPIERLSDEAAATDASVIEQLRKLGYIE
jgi:predicted AlkP superfamily pyrophosphatase or phosphodiesterase